MKYGKHALTMLFWIVKDRYWAGFLFFIGMDDDDRWRNEFNFVDHRTFYHNHVKYFGQTNALFKRVYAVFDNRKRFSIKRLLLYY